MEFENEHVDSTNRHCGLDVGTAKDFTGSCHGEDIANLLVNFLFCDGNGLVANVVEKLA